MFYFFCLGHTLYKKGEKGTGEKVDKKQTEIFDAALYAVCERVAAALFLLPEEIKCKAQEIRLRCGKAVALTMPKGIYYITPVGGVQKDAAGCLKVDKNDLNESFRLLCRGSVYSRVEQIKNGYVSMKGGHRAGVCGVFCDGGISFVSSINYRLSRQAFGTADYLLSAYKGGGVLIAGPPGSGKTTLLRDFIRLLSSGAQGSPYRVAVVDTRGEISATFEGVSYNDLGENTDVLLGVEKGEGTELAIRTLYPHFVAFDEIGGKDELKAVLSCMGAGVSLITTAHVGAKAELMTREITRELLLSGGISTVVLLSRAEKRGEILNTYEVIKAWEQ
ncbi:MAG: hypothetical protein IJ946_06720 [Clostridia bacterium]|nr:hypothetical protein [Clostridia bacterium]